MDKDIVKCERITAKGSELFCLMLSSDSKGHNLNRRGATVNLTSFSIYQQQSIYEAM